MASPAIKRKKSQDESHHDTAESEALKTENDAITNSRLSSKETETCLPTTESEVFQKAVTSDDDNEVNRLEDKNDGGSNKNGKIENNRDEKEDAKKTGTRDNDVGSDGDTMDDTTRKVSANNDVDEFDDDDDLMDTVTVPINSNVSSSREALSPSTSSTGPALSVIKDKYGYHFDAEGRFKDVKTGESFQFDVFGGDRNRNQKRYEAIGDLITLHIYDLLETSVNLHRRTIPTDATGNEASGFVFASEDFDSNPNLVVLIHGSGVVRAGQWARRLIINDSLETGTQLPYIRQAISRGFAVLVLNTNQNSSFVSNVKSKLKKDKKPVEEEMKIRGSETPLKHGVYVFENYVLPNKNVKNIFVVAHSFGGVVTLEIASKFQSFWRSRVQGVAFTDSMHGEHKFFNDTKLKMWFAKNAVNWITSDRPVNTPLDDEGTVPCVSAGHVNHENTSSSAMECVYKYFDGLSAGK